MSGITITLWNGTGLPRQAANTLTDTFHSSTLIFITETWLLSPTRYLTSWTQHHTYASPVPNTGRGRNGIALLIHPDCRYPVNVLPTSSPYLLSCQIADTLIHCTYLPPSLSSAEVEAFLADLPLLTHSSQFNTLICGDFNARHTQLLGDRRSNTCGRILNHWIQAERLICWNQQLAFGQPTYIAKRSHRMTEDTSILDLFLSTCPLANASMNLSYDVDLMSDHKPVHLSFSLALPPPPPASDHPRLLWRLSKLADDKFHRRYVESFRHEIAPIARELRQAVGNDDDPSMPSSSPDLDAAATAVTNAIHTALDQSVGRKSPRAKDVKWFWTETLEQAHQHRELYYRRMRKAEGLQKAVWHTRHRAAAASFRSLLQQRRRQTWKKFCTDLATQDFSKTTATIKRIRTNRQTHAVFTDPAGPSAAADRMVAHLGTVFDGSSLPSDRAAGPSPPPGPHSLDDCPFSPEVVQDALDRVARRKAPGIDHLRAEMLAPISHFLVPPLTDLFRLCWRWSHTPESWRVAQVVPIHKKGPATDPANFRPISLLSVLRKVMEICLTNPLHAASPPLDLAQGGFRPNRSALDQALCLRGLAHHHRRHTVWGCGRR